MDIKVMILVLFIFFLPLMMVKAEECPFEEQLRLREIAGSTTFSYELNDEGMFYLYDIYISGITNEIYVVEEDGYLEFRYQEGSNVAKSLSVFPDSTHKLVYYATNASKCPGFRIMTRNIIVPYYNPYSTHPLCEGYENAPLCQKNSNIYTLIKDEADFVSRMNAYIESLKNKNNNPKPNEEDEEISLWDIIIKFIIDYYFYILISIIVFGTAGIIILELKRRRSIL